MGMGMELKNNNQILLLLLITLSTLPLISLSADPAQGTPPAPPGPGQSWMADPKIDPQLKDICKATKDPEMCLQWYFTYTGEDKPDPSINKKAILRKVLEVGKKMSLEFYTLSINRSAEQYGKDENAYGLYDKCAKNFVVASKEYITAKEVLLKDNDVASCKNGITGASEQYKTCDESFAAAPATPKIDTAQLFKLAELCMDLANTL